MCPADDAEAVVKCLCPALNGSPYVLFLGRLHRKKRLDLLVQAFLVGAPAEYKLVVAGPDEEGLWSRISNQVLAGQESNRIIRLGLVTGREKAAILQQASLFALPSEHENFGIAALEALTFGTRVLLSPQVDLADAAVQSGLGHIAPLDVDEWRRNLAVLLASTVAPKTAEHGKQWCLQHFAWREIVQVLMQRYYWVLDGCPTSEAPGPELTPTSSYRPYSR